jgi:hypothetical protein
MRATIASMIAELVFLNKTCIVPPSGLTRSKSVLRDGLGQHRRLGRCKLSTPVYTPSASFWYLL